jgi:hypothetical protein
VGHLTDQPEGLVDHLAVQRRPVRRGDCAGAERLHAIDVPTELAVVEPLVPRAVHAVHGEPLGPLAALDVSRLDGRIGQHRGERVHRPVEAGAVVEEATRRRRVEQRRHDGRQRAVAGPERFAVVQPAHALERQIEVSGQPLGHEPGRHQRGVRAGFQHGPQVPDVIVVVVGEVDPPHVGRVDQREGVLQPLVAVEVGARIDDHRLLGSDDDRVQVDTQRRPGRLVQLPDDERVLGDLVRLDLHVLHRSPSCPGPVAPGHDPEHEPTRAPPHRGRARH